MTELAERQGREAKMSAHQPSWLQPGATLLLPVGTSIAPATAPDRGNHVLDVLLFTIVYLSYPRKGLPQHK